MNLDETFSSIKEHFKNYKSTVEFTSDGSIFFTFVLNEDIEIHYDLFIEEIGKEKEVIFLVFYKKDCIITGWDSVKGSFERIDKVLKDILNKCKGAEQNENRYN